MSHDVRARFISVIFAFNFRHIVSKSGKEKLRKLKTLEGVFVGENAKVLWGGNP